MNIFGFFLLSCFSALTLAAIARKDHHRHRAAADVDAVVDAAHASDAAPAEPHQAEDENLIELAPFKDKKYKMSYEPRSHYKARSECISIGKAAGCLIEYDSLEEMQHIAYQMIEKELRGVYMIGGVAELKSSINHWDTFVWRWEKKGTMIKDGWYNGLGCEMRVPTDRFPPPNEDEDTEFFLGIDSKPGSHYMKIKQYDWRQRKANFICQYK